MKHIFKKGVQGYPLLTFCPNFAKIHKGSEKKGIKQLKDFHPDSITIRRQNGGMQRKRNLHIFAKIGPHPQ